MNASCSSGDGSSSESGEYTTDDENRPKPTIRSGIQLLRDEYSKRNQRNPRERSKHDKQSSYSKSQSQKNSKNSSRSQRSRSRSPIDRSRRNNSDNYRKSKSHRDEYRSSRSGRNSPRRRNYDEETPDSDYERNQNRYSERHYNSSWSRYDDRIKHSDGRRNNWNDDRSRRRSRDRDRDRSRRERNHSPKKRHIEHSEDRNSPSRERNDKKQDKKNVEENNRKSPSPSKETSQPRNGEKETHDRDSENKDPNTPAPEDTQEQSPAKKTRLEQEENITTRTGGAYIPPARLRMMQAQITDKSSIQYQRIAWEALKKSINGLINKVNVPNIVIIVRELFKENIVRGRGVLARSIMQAQAASPTFTHVYAAFTAIINTKFPQIGELILRRLIIQFRRGFKRNDKNICLSATRFIAHLVNQQVAHEVLALEILTLLLENPTDDSVEVGIGFLKECGMKLTEVSPRGIHAVFERLRSILHEGQLDKRVQYMIEVMFAIRKDSFKDHQAVLEELDRVEEEDQFTHLLTLDEATNSEDILNVFKHEPDYEENEAKYLTLRKEILDESSSGSEGEGEEGDEGESDSDAEEAEEESKMIIDNTETNLVSLRRTIYLTIQSSLDFEECAHKILKMELKPGQEVELCHMILDCCAQQRTYEKFFGLLAQRFCQLNKIYVTPNEQIFRDSYDTIHRLETNKLRNVAKFFAHLLYTDAIGWIVLSHIRLNEEDTTSSSRIFIKILFQELSEYMGLPRLNERVKDPTLQEAFDGLFPRDNPRNTRFAINFFTSIGLGGLTDELREHLKSQPKQQVVVPPTVESESESSSSSSSDDGDSEDSDSSSDSESDSSDSDSTSGSDSSVEMIQKKSKEPQHKNKEKEYRGRAKENKNKEKEKEYRKEDSRSSKLHHDKRSKSSRAEHKHKHRSKT